MSRSHRRFAAAATSAVAALFVLPAAVAHGSVILSFTDNDATPTATTVAAGSSFSVTLNLVSTAEQTIGLSYYLQEAAFVSGTPRFRIADRNLTASTYNDDLVADATVEAQPSSLLNPRNDNDLGAVLANPAAPNGAGTFLVATYSIAVPTTTPGGTYILSTFSNPGEGYTASPPADVPFTAHATFNVTVTPVPEPGALAITGLGALWLAARRRLTR